MNWNEIGANFLANFLAFIAGIPIGLYVDRMISQIGAHEQTNAHLQTIIDELETNTKILENIVMVLGDKSNVDRIPTPNVIITAWGTAKISGFLQSYTDWELLNTILLIYRDLEEIETRIEQLWQLLANSPKSENSPRFRLLADRATDLAIKVNLKIQSYIQSNAVLTIRKKTRASRN